MRPDPSDSLPPGVGDSLWERIIRDPAYVLAKDKIQARYGLPLPFNILQDDRKWRDWMGAEEKPVNKKARREKTFLKDVSALFKKFEVPETWYPDFIADIAGVSSEPSVEGPGSPRFNLFKDSDGNWNWECIITPETDLANPQILELIQRGQKEHAGDPPRPAKDKDHPRRLDWRPVHEWHKRYPVFSVEEIAEKINYPPRVVRRKFAEIESNE